LSFCVRAGAGANTRDSPANVTDYMPSESDVGGLFDDNSRAKQIYSKSKAAKTAAAPPAQQQQQVVLARGGSAATVAAAVAAAAEEEAAAAGGRAVRQQ
jgi:digalactosyldiacylglycerol synthase